MCFWCVCVWDSDEEVENKQAEEGFLACVPHLRVYLPHMCVGGESINGEREASAYL